MSHPIPQEVEERLAQFMRDFILISEPLTVHQRVEAQEALLSVYNSGSEDVAIMLSKAGENSISLLNNNNFTGTYWISLNAVYFKLTGRHINSDWENGTLEKNPEIEALIRNTVSSPSSEDNA